MQRFSWRTAAFTETDARGCLAEQEQARLRGDELNFALAGPHDQDVLLGAVSLHEVRLDQGRAAVGYWLAPGARGRVPRYRRSGCSPGGHSPSWDWPGWS